MWEKRLLKIQRRSRFEVQQIIIVGVGHYLPWIAYRGMVRPVVI
jgi:hypothetical protein